MQENGKQWYDVQGNTIQAHGGWIIFAEGYYWWYGENRRGNRYVSCYRSTDLETWEFRRNVLTTESRTEAIRHRTDLNLMNAGRKVNIERPKVLFCRQTGKYVMWAHYENGENYLDARCCIATCDTPDGDFVYHGSFNPYGYMSRDCTLFQDDDGKAYFLSAARDNADLHVYLLSEDLLNVKSTSIRFGRENIGKRRRCLNGMESITSYPPTALVGCQTRESGQSAQVWRNHFPSWRGLEMRRRLIRNRPLFFRWTRMVVRDTSTGRIAGAMRERSSSSKRKLEIRWTSILDRRISFC